MIVLVLGATALVAGRIALSLMEWEIAAPWPPGGDDLYGDAIPADALARLGTVRLRRTTQTNLVWLDDQRIASGGFDREIVIWDAATGERLQELSGHRVETARSPDTWSFRQLRHVLTGGDPPTFYDDLDALRVLPSGRLLSTGESIRMWDLDAGTGRFVARQRGGPIGSPFALVDRDRTLVYSWVDCLRRFDLASGKEMARVPTGKDLTVLCFFPDGGSLLMTRDDGADLVLVDTTSGALRSASVPGVARVYQAIFAPGGETFWALVSESAESRRPVHLVRVDAETLDVRDRHPLQDGHWGLLAISPDGELMALIAFVDGDNDRVVMDTATGNELWRAETQVNSRWGAAAFSSDSRRIAWSVDPAGSVQVLDARTGADLVPLSAHEAFVAALAFTSDSQVVVSASADGTLRGWDATTSRALWSRAAGDVVGLVPTGASARVLIARPHAVESIDGATGVGAPGATTDGHVQFVGSDGSVITATDAGLTFRATRRSRPVLFARSRRAEPGADDAGEFATGVLAYDTEARVALTEWESRTPAGDPGNWSSISSLHVMNVETASELASVLAMGGGSGDVIRAASLPRLTYVAVASWGGEIVLSSAHGVGEELVELRRAHPEDTTVVRFSPSGTRLATGGDDGIVRVWSIPELVQLQELRGHGAAIRSLAFSPNGNVLASGSDDTSILLWDVREP